MRSRAKGARAVAQPPLQSGPVVSGDAHRGVAREAAAGPGEPVAGITGIEQAVAGEPVQHAAADLLFDHGSRFRLSAAACQNWTPPACSGSNRSSRMQPW